MKLTLAILLMMCLLVACTGGNVGSASGVSTNCTTSGEGKTCHVEISKLNGSYTLDLEENRNADYGECTIAASITNGDMEILLTGPDNETTTIPVSSTNNAIGSGKANLIIDSFYVKLNALNETQVEGVVLDITYVLVK